MKPSCFSEEQIIGMLKEQEAVAKTAHICRKYGISAATFYKVKGKYGGMDVSYARRLKALAEGNARLKTLLAHSHGLRANRCRAGEQMLDNTVLKDVDSKKMTPDAKRKAVAHACDAHRVSQRRACKALNADRTSVRYRSIRPDDELREAMKAVATQRRRFGYPRIQVMLEREGITMNQKKLRRLYRDRPRRSYLITAPNLHQWPSCTGVSKAASNGIASRPESRCRRTLRAIPAVFIESFNGCYRHECLNDCGAIARSVCSRRSRSARAAIRVWKEDYNQHRPHSSLDNEAPAGFAVQIPLEARAA